MGYLHKMDFDNGLELNYSLFYKYDNFLNKLNSCNYLFRNGNQAKVVGQEYLTFGTEASYKPKDNVFVRKLSQKFVINHEGVKTTKTIHFKGYQDYFDSFDFTWKTKVLIYYLINFFRLKEMHLTDLFLNVEWDLNLIKIP